MDREMIKQAAKEAREAAEVSPVGVCMELIAADALIDQLEAERDRLREAATWAINNPDSPKSALTHLQRALASTTGD